VDNEGVAIEFPASGSCFYKLDFVVDEDIEFSMEREVTNVVDALREHDAIGVQVLAGHEVERRMYFQLSDPCTQTLKLMSDAIVGYNQKNPELIDEITKSNQCEAQLRWPDIRKDFGARVDYYEPEPGSCDFSVVLVHGETGRALTFDDVPQELRTTIESSNIAVMPDSFWEGRAYLSLQEPCSDQFDKLSGAIADLNSHPDVDVIRFSAGP
jgi:hypothetical protein